MRITQIQIKHFRCFGSYDLALTSPIVLIEGINGTGKTSFLEALHYLCYLRSFRTHLPQELVQFGHDNFFIKASLHANNDSYDLQVGFSNKKKLIKVNNKAISSYKELLEYYRIVTVTEDDLALIKEGPEIRRSFIDQAIVLANPDFVQTIKRCKDVVENRTVLLKRGGSWDSYLLWTEQLWQLSCMISQERIKVLEQLEQEVRFLISTYFNNEFSISFTYCPKKQLTESFGAFLQEYPNLYDDERRLGRALFGVNLDDFGIQFKDIKSKSFASRGQQKLILVLLKIAQIRLLTAQKGPAILLLDDFMTDFDNHKTQTLIAMLAGLNIQLIFTIPTPDSFLHKELVARGAQRVVID